MPTYQYPNSSVVHVQSFKYFPKSSAWGGGGGGAGVRFPLGAGVLLKESQHGPSHEEILSTQSLLVAASSLFTIAKGDV